MEREEWFALCPLKKKLKKKGDKKCQNQKSYLK